jgi:hypothetical protein
MHVLIKLFTLSIILLLIILTILQLQLPPPPPPTPITFPIILPISIGVEINQGEMTKFYPIIPKYTRITSQLANTYHHSFTTLVENQSNASIKIQTVDDYPYTRQVGYFSLDGLYNSTTTPQEINISMTIILTAQHNHTVFYDLLVIATQQQQQQHQSISHNNEILPSNWVRFSNNLFNLLPNNNHKDVYDNLYNQELSSIQQEFPCKNNMLTLRHASYQGYIPPHEQSGRYIMGIDLSTSNTVTVALVQNPNEIPQVIYTYEPGNDLLLNNNVMDNQLQQQTSEDTLTMILSHIKSAANNSTLLINDEPINKAVVCVPFYYNDQMRTMIKNAGTNANLKIERIINGPTCAGIGYEIEHNQSQEIILFTIQHDHQQNYMSITMMSIDSGVFEYIAPANVTDTFKISTDIDDLAKIKQQMKQLVKEGGSIYNGFSNSDHKVYIMYFGSSSLSLTNDNDTFKSFVQDTIMNQVKLHPQIAGSNPSFHFVTSPHFPSQHAAAIGAARQGAILNGLTSLPLDEGCIDYDFTPFTIGVATRGGIMHPILPKMSIFKWGNHKTVAFNISSFSSSVENNNNVAVIKVFLGEHELVKDNIEIGRFEVYNSSEQIQIDMELLIINSGGILVSVRGSDGNVIKSIVFDHYSHLVDYFGYENMQRLIGRVNISVQTENEQLILAGRMIIRKLLEEEEL